MPAAANTLRDGYNALGLAQRADGEPIHLELWCALADVADDVKDSAAPDLLAFMAFY